MYSVTAALKRLSCSSALATGTCCGQLRVLQLLHREQGLGARELALHDRDQLRPRVRDELDVLQVPVVVLDADARRRGLRSLLRLEPRGQGVGRLHRLLDVGLEGGGRAHELRAEQPQIGALLLQPLRSVEPEVVPVAREVDLRLREQARNRADLGADLRRGLRRQRVLVRPELEGAGRVRPFARRLVALLPEHRDVEGGDVRPRLQDAVVEVEPGELRAHDLVVDLLRDGPRARIDRGQTLLPGLELLLLRGHRGGAVVRHSVHELRLLERAPVSKEGDEVLVSAGRRRGMRASSDQHPREQTHSYRKGGRIA